jgi:hypothetical protein
MSAAQDGNVLTAHVQVAVHTSRNDGASRPNGGSTLHVAVQEDGRRGQYGVLTDYRVFFQFHGSRRRGHQRSVDAAMDFGDVPRRQPRAFSDVSV